MALFVGTSGWAYKEWRRGFYPEDLPQASFLEHYGRVLTACEVNATFYRLQSEKTMSKWATSVPERFRFAVKAHRRLTHFGKPIAHDEEAVRFLDRFLASTDPLGDRRGCVLFQFSSHRRRVDDSFLKLIEAIGGRLPFACEFRHESWLGNDVEEMTARAGGTICLADTKGQLPDQLPGGPIAYVRLRSPKYTSNVRDGWLELLQREAESRDVYAFAKHEGVPAGDPFAGVGLAQWLVQRAT